MTIIPAAQQVVAANRPLLGLLVEAIRKGTVHAQEYADWQDETIDRALAPALVRKGAKRHLIDLGQNAENEEDIDYDTAFLPNLGLAISAAGIQIRILRSATNDMLPVPGHSEARKQYYTQMGFLFEDMTEPVVAEPVAVLRLVLHWSTDQQYQLERVYLGCPKAGGETRDSVESYWDEPIWRRHNVEIDGQVQAEVTDLDIYLEDEATGTGG